jgi:hypothetical protein
MSLGSRISNLFTSNSNSSGGGGDSAQQQQQHLGPLIGRDYDTPMDNAGAATKVTEAAGVSAPRKRKEESEGRSPYLHVCLPPSLPPSPPRRKNPMADGFEGVDDVGGWTRWQHG